MTITGTHYHLSTGKTSVIGVSITDARTNVRSRVEAQYLIEKLTLSRSAVICDPFLGSGEFAIPAIQLGYPFIGIEKDKETFERARNYITKETVAAVSQSG